MENPIDKKPGFYHEERDRLYTRIVAGLCLPTAQYGFVAVVAEELEWGAVPRIQAKYHLIAECEEATTDALLARCLELKKQCEISAFYGTRSNEGSMKYLAHWSRKQRESRMPEIHLRAAPHSEDGKIAFHLQLIRGLTEPGDTTFYFFKGSKLPGYISELPSDVTDLKAADHPAAAALGYALSVLATRPYRVDDRPEVAKMDYPLFRDRRRRKQQRQPEVADGMDVVFTRGRKRRTR